MFKEQNLKNLIAILCILVMFSALSVVYSKHKTRLLYASLQAYQKQVDDLHIEWSQLLLEQGAWTTNSRVEKIASEQLQMQLPGTDKIVVIKNANP